MPDAIRPEGLGTPLPGGLAAEALRRGKRLRRRRIAVRRGATTLVLASALAIGIALRLGGPPSSTRPVDHGSTTLVPMPGSTVQQGLTVWATDGRFHLPGYTGALMSVPGRCSSGSAVSGQADAWRCTTGTTEYDPCVSPPDAADAALVVCFATPWAKPVEIGLTSPLPVAAGDEPGATVPPWALQLADGERCVRGTGARPTKAGVQLDYLCDRGSAGGLVTSGRRWTVRYLPDGLQALGTVAVSVAWTVAPESAPAAPVCAASWLSGTFAPAPGGGSAGHVVYVLQLRNKSPRPCTLSGFPSLSLLGKSGNGLPSGQFTPSEIEPTLTLVPGASAHSNVLFSPDVPGTGEPTNGGQCEPTAYTLLVLPPPGSYGGLNVAIQPPTPVCEHGQMQISALSLG